MSGRWRSLTISMRRKPIAAGRRRSVSVRSVSVAARRMWRTGPVSVRPGTTLASAESLPVTALVEGVEFRELFLVEDIRDLRAGIRPEFAHGLAAFPALAFGAPPLRLPELPHFTHLVREYRPHGLDLFIG